VILRPQLSPEEWEMLTGKVKRELIHDLAPVLAEEINRAIERFHDRHLTADHCYGAIGELVDHGVSMRFDEYARFLIRSSANQQISAIAAEMDADEEGEGAS
jgi:hypothetical protein